MHAWLSSQVCLREWTVCLVVISVLALVLESVLCVNAAEMNQEN